MIGCRERCFSVMMNESRKGMKLYLTGPGKVNVVVV